MSGIHLAGYTFSYIQVGIASAFAFALILQLFVYLFFYVRVFFFRKKKEANAEQRKLPSVSIVICARNEKKNLDLFLPEVLEQKYPDFQVVVVDDCSTDGTPALLTVLKEDYPHLYYTKIDSDRVFDHSKKLALNIGLKAAKNDIVVLTDADCKPTSEFWLKEMVEQFDEKTNFVLGYGGYEARPGLLNYLIRFDTALIGLRYLSFAKAGVPYMGVGRNMAYRKHLFFENNGLGKYSGMKSGDDDLLVNKFARGRNTKVCVSDNSLTRSVPKLSWGEWRRQKKRHFTTAPYYRFVHKFLLGLEPFSRLLFYVSFIASIVFFPTFVYYFIAAFVFRYTIQLMVYYKAFEVFGEKRLIWGTLFLDVMLPIVYIWLGWPKKTYTRKQSSWM